MVCVPTTFSVSFTLEAWQMTTMLRLLRLMLNVTFELVIQPPFGADSVFEALLSKLCPSTVHLMSAGGFEFSVVQVMTTWSSALASVGPVMVTPAGATVYQMKRVRKLRLYRARAAAVAESAPGRAGRRNERSRFARRIVSSRSRESRG